MASWALKPPHTINISTSKWPTFGSRGRRRRRRISQQPELSKKNKEGRRRDTLQGVKTSPESRKTMMLSKQTKTLLHSLTVWKWELNVTVAALLIKCFYVVLGPVFPRVKHLATSANSNLFLYSHLPLYPSPAAPESPQHLNWRRTIQPLRANVNISTNSVCNAKKVAGDLSITKGQHWQMHTELDTKCTIGII